MTKATNHRQLDMVIVANRVAVPVEAPSRILVLPWGNVDSKQGSFTVDRDAANRIVAAFKAHGVEVPIDREHATLGGKYAPPDGSAPAMAWIKSLESVEDQGIYAEVEWTEKGQEHVQKKEYRYLSPTLLHRKSDRAVMELHSVGLTNKPAIVGMDPIVNKDDVMALSEETWERARWFLNLPTTATETEIMDQFEKLLTQLRELAGVTANTDQQGTLAALSEKLKAAAPITALASTLKPELCKALALKEDVTDEAIVKACSDAVAKAQAPDPSKYVPSSVVQDLTKELTALKEDRLKEKTEAFLKRGDDLGKIVEVNKGMWERSYKADPEQAEKDLVVAPVCAPANGRRVTPVQTTAAGAGIANDTIVANSEQFAGERMGDYQKIAKYATEKNLSFEKAMEACGAL